MSLVPEITKFRYAVEQIKNRRDQVLIKTVYLLAARVSEVITKTSPWDLTHNKTKAYGQFMSHQMADFNGQEVYLTKQAVLKRKVKKKKAVENKIYKIIALPVAPKFEPWTIELMEWSAEQGSLSFDLGRRAVLKIVKKNLGKLDNAIPTHSLRHYRITHLVTMYNFDAFDLIAYTGWTFKTGLGMTGMGGASGQLDTYLHLAWRRYYPKLLKHINA